MVSELKKVVSRKLSPFQAEEGSGTYSDYWNLKNGVSPLRKIRKAKGFTLNRLSLASGISASYLSRIEVKARRMNEEVLRRLCAVLSCTPADLLMGPKEGATPVVLNAFANDFPVYQIRNENGKTMINFQEKAKWVFRPAELTAEESAFAFQLMDDSFAPKFNVNDTVYVNPAKALVSGANVLVILQSNQILLGTFVSQDANTVSIKINGIPSNYDASQVKAVNAVHLCLFS